MGHAIGYGFLSAKTKEEALKEGLKRAKAWACDNTDRYENPYGDYHGNFKIYNSVFNSEAEALKFFSALGSYKDGIVRVKRPRQADYDKFAKEVNKVNTDISRAKKNALDDFKRRTSATVGCKRCGTRAPRDTIVRLDLLCPSCGNLMAPDSVKKRMIDLFNVRRALEVKFNQEVANGGELCYWAKYEVHC